MYQNILMLDDGTQIRAGPGGSAIQSIIYTSTVESETDLTPGAACAGKIEFVVWVQPGTNLVFTSGTRIRYYQQDDTGAQELIGTFWAVKPTKQSRNTYKVYAYDAVSKLDSIQSAWLQSIQDDFPMSLWAFAQAVAQRCGVTIANTSLPRAGDYQVQAFYADDLTGRQLLSWVAQAACTFLRATPSGDVEFAWYTENAITGIFPEATEHWTALNLSGQIFTCADGSVWTYNQDTAAYRRDGLSYEEYQTATIDKVQLKQSDDDVGVIYPPDATGTNALVIQGNLLLAPTSSASLSPIAQAIYETMQDISYTPLKASLFSDGRTVMPGQIITATDPWGNALQTYVMTVQQQGGQISVESTGNASRDGTAAVNEQKYTNLQGRLLEISASVDGLKVTAKDLTGQYTELSQTVESITLTAENDGDSSRLSISANGIELSSTDITFEGMVTFADLSGSGTSVINGDNIVTGVIEAESGNTEYNLVNGYIRSGPSAGTRFEINANRVNWYVDNYLTGVLYSVYGTSYLGANSRYTRYGWVNSATPSSYLGMQVDQVSSQAAFNTLHVDLTNTNGQLGVSGSISARDLSVWGSKNRVVRTPLGNLAFAAMESPEPAFCDWGGGTIGEDGVCPVCFSQQYAAGICLRQAVRWLVTPVDGPGSFWVERTDWGALVHGQPGSRFDWMCIGVQADMGALYAPESAATTPVESDPAVERALADILDGEREAMEILMEVQQ